MSQTPKDLYRIKTSKGAVRFNSVSEPIVGIPAESGLNGGESTFEPTPEVVSIDYLRSIGKFCPNCRKFAVVPLTASQLAKQPDNTNHVCHPSIGGCNQGYGPA